MYACVFVVSDTNRRHLILHFGGLPHTVLAHANKAYDLRDRQAHVTAHSV